MFIPTDYNNTALNTSCMLERAIRMNDSLVASLCTEYTLNHQSDTPEGIEVDMSAEMERLKISIGEMVKKCNMGQRTVRREYQNTISLVFNNMSILQNSVSENFTLLHDVLLELKSNHTNSLSTLNSTVYALHDNMTSAMKEREQTNSEKLRLRITKDERQDEELDYFQKLLRDKSSANKTGIISKSLYIKNQNCLKLHYLS